MQFTAKTDIEASLAAVLAALSDFEGWERAAMRRGAEVSRTDTMRTPGPGMAWATSFVFRGKERAFDIKLMTMDPAGKMAFSGTGKMLAGDMELDLVSLAPNRTRLVMDLNVRPLTLGARLMLQTLKLGRGKVQKKLDTRLVQFARDVELRRPGGGGQRGLA